MNKELYHHGILGQKWGIRRFQRKDGSLTSEGKAHKSLEKNSDEKKPREITDPRITNRRKTIAAVSTAILGTAAGSLLCEYGQTQLAQAVMAVAAVAAPAIYASRKDYFILEFRAEEEEE